MLVKTIPCSCPPEQVKDLLKKSKEALEDEDISLPVVGGGEAGFYAGELIFWEVRPYLNDAAFDDAEVETTVVTAWGETGELED